MNLGVLRQAVAYLAARVDRKGQSAESMLAPRSLSHPQRGLGIFRDSLSTFHLPTECNSRTVSSSLLLIVFDDVNSIRLFHQQNSASFCSVIKNILNNFTSKKSKTSVQCLSVLVGLETEFAAEREPRRPVGPVG